MSAPYISGGLGTSLGYSTTNSGYTSIAQLVSIDGPNTTMGKVETTNLSSTVKTQRPTLKDPGEVSFKIWYDPADTTHTGLDGYYSSKTVLYFQELYNYAGGSSPAHSAVYQGFLSDRKTSGLEPEGNLTVEWTITVVSDITLS